MRIKRRKYRTLAFAYKTAGLLWGLVHVCAVVGFLTDWTQPLLYAGIGLFSLLTVNACIGGCWRAEARADRLTRQIAETDHQQLAGGTVGRYQAENQRRTGAGAPDRAPGL